MKNTPAFPFSSYQNASEGMTLRDYFAAKAMQAFIGRPALDSNTMQSISAMSYRMADAMLEAREVGHE